MGRRIFRSYYKGHMDKTNGEGGSKGGRSVWLGLWGVLGRKCRQLQLTNNKKSLIKKKSSVRIKEATDL